MQLAVTSIMGSSQVSAALEAIFDRFADIENMNVLQMSSSRWESTLCASPNLFDVECTFSMASDIYSNVSSMNGMLDGITFNQFVQCLHLLAQRKFPTLKSEDAYLKLLAFHIFRLPTDLFLEEEEDFDDEDDEDRNYDNDISASGDFFQHGESEKDQVFHDSKVDLVEESSNRKILVPLNDQAHRMQSFVSSDMSPAASGSFSNGDNRMKVALSQVRIQCFMFRWRSHTALRLLQQCDEELQASRNALANVRDRNSFVRLKCAEAIISRLNHRIISKRKSDILHRWRYLIEAKHEKQRLVASPLTTPKVIEHMSSQTNLSQWKTEKPDVGEYSPVPIFVFILVGIITTAIICVSWFIVMKQTPLQRDVCTPLPPVVPSPGLIEPTESVDSPPPFMYVNPYGRNSIHEIIY
jgi:hypothetical protein